MVVRLHPVTIIEDTMICEECGNEHDGTYGTGRFCSRKCQYKHIGKQSNKNGKLNGHLPTHKPAGHGTWVCPHCGATLESRSKLTNHKKSEHPDKTTQFVIVNGKRKMIGHAWNKGLSVDTDDRVKQYVDTLSTRYANGELSGTFTGRMHSDETKQKIRGSTLEYINKTAGGPRYNVTACAYFDRLNEERGWNLRHALNGGEVRVGRYSLDAYDEARNIVVEYDEHRHHYTNGVRPAKDIERERTIKEITGCTFYRYLSFDDVLVEV